MAYSPSNFQRKHWVARTTPEEVARRASGRRHFNAVRTLQATVRRGHVSRLLLEYGHGYGVQRRIAKELRVSASTICRDVKFLLQLLDEQE
jgi:hypothetical protein